MSSKKYAVLAGICLLLTFSPVGAPAVGVLITSACPVDTSVAPNGPFALPFHYCGLSQTVEHLYQRAIFLPLIAVATAGRIIGGTIALVWFAAAFALPVTFLWNAARAIWARRHAASDSALFVS